jgi:hypothetical protein
LLGGALWQLARAVAYEVTNLGGLEQYAVATTLAHDARVICLASASRSLGYRVAAG